MATRCRVATALRCFVTALEEHATDSTMAVAVRRQCIMAKPGVPMPSYPRTTSSFWVQFDFLHLAEARQDSSGVGWPDGEDLQPLGMKLVPCHAQ